jgi:hypothetical protein
MIEVPHEYATWDGPEMGFVMTFREVAASRLGRILWNRTVQA